MAKHLKLDLQVVAVHDDDFIETLPTLMEHYAHPFMRRPDSVPFFSVSQLVREHGVKGVLSGEAADECFLGYQSMMPKVRSLWQWLPRPSPTALRNVARRILQGSRAELERRDVKQDVASALTNRFEVELERAAIAATGADGRPLIRPDDQKTLHALNYHLRTLLHRNDSLGMAASIESRFPFLDTRVVRFAANLPHSLKIPLSPTLCDVRHPFLRDKWILREVARRYVPRQISHRPKRAFPSHAFRRMEISDRFFHDSFVSQFFELSRGQVDYLNSHARRDLKLRLLQLEVWGQVSLCAGRKEQILSRLRTHVRVAPDRA